VWQLVATQVLVVPVLVVPVLEVELAAFVAVVLLLLVLPKQVPALVEMAPPSLCLVQGELQ
jgi:hypothetical protein